MKTFHWGILATGLLLALPGCALLSSTHPTQTVYALALAPESARPQSAVLHSWQIQVAEPQATAALQGTRILVQPLPGQVQVYAEARWQDTPSQLLQSLIVQSLRERAHLPAVTGSASLMRADFRLESDVLAFQSEYRGAPLPTAVVRIDARLVRLADGKVVSANTFALEQSATGTDVPAVVSAFDHAANALMASLTPWVLTAGDEAQLPQH